MQIQYVSLTSMSSKRNTCVNLTASFYSVCTNLLWEYISYDKIFNILHIFLLPLLYHDRKRNTMYLPIDRLSLSQNMKFAHRIPKYKLTKRYFADVPLSFSLPVHSLSNHYHRCVNEYRYKRSRIHHAPSTPLRWTASFRHISLSSR